MFVLMGVTLYTSRIVLDVLGVDRYGVWNLIAGVVVLFSFVQNAMNTAIQRFISYNLGKYDNEGALNILYNSKTILYYLCLFFVIISETAGLFFVYKCLNIPVDLMWSTFVLYQLVIINTIFLIIRIPYNACVIAHENMSFYSITSLIEGGLSLLIVYALCILPGDVLVNYGVLTICVSLIMFFWYALYCKQKWGIKVIFCKHESIVFKELFSFSGFTMLGSLSSIFSSQGLNFLLNMFFNVAVNAAMGIANQVNSAVYKFVTNFQTAFKPHIVKLYSSNNKSDLYNLIYLASRMSFFMMWVISCPLFINVNYILEFWLEEVPLYTSHLCILMIICSLIECISSPLWMTVQATGNIKQYQITVSLTNISVVIISYLLLTCWLNVNVVLISKLIIDTVILIERLFFSKKIFGLSLIDFIQATILKYLIISIVSFVICYCTHNVLFSNYSIVTIAIDIFFSCIINFILIYCIGMTKQEKIVVKSIIVKKIYNG